MGIMNRLGELFKGEEEYLEDGEDYGTSYTEDEEQETIEQSAARSSRSVRRRP